jgi:hypothetical protein
MGVATATSSRIHSRGTYDCYPLLSRSAGVLLLAVCTSCSPNSSTYSDVEADQHIPDSQSANVCESIRTAINRRSLTLLHRPAGLPLPLSAYKVYVNEVQPQTLALINLEEQLYGVWRNPTDRGLCQLTMMLLENPRAFSEVAHYMRTHDLDSPNTRIYDGEFRNLAKSSDEESEYLDSVFAIRDGLDELSSPVATARKLVPMIGINASSRKEAAELFSSLQERLDAVYGVLPPFAQWSVAEALNATAH